MTVVECALNISNFCSLSCTLTYTGGTVDWKARYYGHNGSFRDPERRTETT